MRVPGLGFRPTVVVPPFKKVTGEFKLIKGIIPNEL